MIKIRIHGIADGRHEIDISVPAAEIDEIYPEYIGDVRLTGTLRKIGNRFSFVGEAACTALLTCDRTLKKFEQLVTAEIKASYLADTVQYRDGDEEVDEFEDNIIHEDQEFIDLTVEVREQLAVAMPMKKIAPDVEDKELEEIYPDYAAGNKKDSMPDDRWEALKKLKSN